MLEVTAKIVADACTVEMLRGEWPKPVEYAWVGDNLILTMMYKSGSYQAEGRYVGTTSTEFSPIGGVFMVPPGHELLGRGTGGEMRAVRCVYKPEIFEQFMGNRKDFTVAQLRKSLSLQSSTIAFYMRRLIEEATSPGFASETMTDAVASLLMIECARQLFAADSSEKEIYQSGLSAKHLRRIEEYLECIDVGAPTVNDIARLCGFSPHYFCKLFRQRTGQSIGRYLAESRLRRAERLLTETDLPLKEVAYRLGFANAANFTTAFRNEMNIPPGTYREQKRANGPALVNLRRESKLLH